MYNDSKQLQALHITLVNDNFSTEVSLSSDTHIPVSLHAPFKLPKPHKIGILITRAKTYQIRYLATETKSNRYYLFVYSLRKSSGNQGTM